MAAKIQYLARHHNGEAAVEETISCLVRGPASRYPRGFLWLVPLWFAVAAAAVEYASYRLANELPMWFGATELGALLIGTISLICVLATVRRHAFRADADGIWLGVLTERKRPKLRQLHLAWTEIAQLQMVARRYGLLLEIRVNPAARIVYQPGVARQALLLLGVLFLPVGFGRGRPALTSPVSDPPRYLIKLCQITPAQLAAALETVTPQALPVCQLPKKGAFRFTIQAQREATARPRLAAAGRR
jgi:hypothetical protein